MKKVLLGLLLLGGCVGVDRLVHLTKTTVPKASTISVPSVVEEYTLTVSSDSITVERSTVPVTIGGSGVLISPDGHIITCAHLFEVGEAGQATVCLSNGDCRPAELLYKETRLDLALLKIETDHPLPYAKIADPRELEVGQEVIAVGTPLGFEFTVTHGIISALNRDGLGVYNMTQSDAFINPGNSGGGLFNMKGELVGINSRIVPPVNANIFTGLGFSVQCGQIREFLTRFKGIEKAWER